MLKIPVYFTLVANIIATIDYLHCDDIKCLVSSVVKDGVVARCVLHDISE